MSINLTDELLAKTKKGKIASAKQVFLDGDKENLQQIGDKTNQLEGAFKDISVSGGASTANAVSYNNETSSMTAVTAQGAIDELAAKNATKAEKSEVTSELAKKFDKESILQESGDAEDKVMSQKATTTAIAEEVARAKAAEEAIIFDVSANNDGAVFESLSALLNSSDLSTLIPTSVRHGGMVIRFIQGSVPNSDNKYIQARLMADSFTTDVTQWQGVDNVPTSGSRNLVESGGVAKVLNKVYGYLAQSSSAKITPTVDDGLVEGYFVAKNGNKNQAEAFGYVQPILLSARATIILNEGNDVYWSNAAVVYECLQDGTFVKQLLGDGAYASKPASYTNNSDSDIYVGICTYKTTLNYRIVSFTKAASETELTTMKANEIKDWILGESFTVTNATYTDGIIGSPVSVTWSDGESGILTLVRDSDGLLTSITATYGTDTYVLTVTRDSDGNATNSTIVKQ